VKNENSLEGKIYINKPQQTFHLRCGNPGSNDVMLCHLAK